MMATHMLAMPSAARSRHSSFTPRAKPMFSLTIRRHLRLILMALAIFSGSSSISTTSAASMAASEPRAPMAIPISARDSTGASLMPSPTKASLRRPPHSLSSSSTQDTLSAGSSSARYSVRPTSEATFLATGSASPVSMTVFSTPARRSSAMACLDVSFNSSAMTMWPL